MAKKHMKRRLTSVVIGKMQVKTTMTYHFTHTRVAIIKIKGKLLVKMYRKGP